MSVMPGMSVYVKVFGHRRRVGECPLSGEDQTSNLNASIKNATLDPPKRAMPMKAAFIERHGGPEVLKLGEMPNPMATSGEVVVDIVAASVNGADWKVREGKSNPLSRFPHILGRDFSGVV